MKTTTYLPLSVLFYSCLQPNLMLIAFSKFFNMLFKLRLS
ncbi:putative membrane protein [Vibrio parahaemolyticus VP2007-095]|nr:putative membrane protein [Vibrio parahaemolyticus VP2007-095]